MFRVTVTDHRGENPAVTTVDGNELHIGRVPGNDLVLPTSKVSKRHARMAIEDGRIVVTDLRSTNGTIFRDSRITGPTVLAEGDAVVIGEFLVRIDQAFYAEGGAEHSSLKLETIPPSPARGAADRPSPISGAVPVHAFIPGVTGPSLSTSAQPARGDMGTDSGRAQAPPPLPARATASNPRVPASPPAAARASAPTAVARETGPTPASRPAGRREQNTINPPALPGALPAFTVAAVHEESAVPLHILAQDPCWFNETFAEAWSAAVNGLLDIVPAEALPQSLSVDSEGLLGTFRELSNQVGRQAGSDTGLPPEHVEALQKLVLSAAVGLGPLDAYLLDPQTADVRVELDGSVSVRTTDARVIRAPLGLPNRMLANRFAQRLRDRMQTGVYRGFGIQAARSPSPVETWWIRLTRLPSDHPSIQAERDAIVLLNLNAELARGNAVLVCVDPLPLTSALVRALLPHLSIRDATVVGRPETGAAVGCVALAPSVVRELACSPSLMIVPAQEPGAVAAWLWHRVLCRTPTLLVTGAKDPSEAFAMLANPASALVPDALGSLRCLTDGAMIATCQGEEFSLQWRPDC